MSRADLAGRLGVSRRRADQIVARLHAAGRIRLASSVVVRADDPTPLLSREEQGVLSALPEGYATTPTKIRLRAKCNVDTAALALRRLMELGLIAGEDNTAGPEAACRLTAAGMGHPQYRRAGIRADPPTLPVRSDRVCAVLALLAERGHARIVDVRDALGIAHQSINALFQYLKRKALVGQDGNERGAAYALTARGQEVLAEMQRRRAA